MSKSSDDRILYGYYSKLAVAYGNPTNFYSTPYGPNVEVTMVTDDPLGRNYLWKDKVFIGPVESWVCSGRNRSRGLII